MANDKERTTVDQRIEHIVTNWPALTEQQRARIARPMPPGRARLDRA